MQITLCRHQTIDHLSGFESDMISIHRCVSQVDVIANDSEFIKRIGSFRLGITLARLSATMRLWVIT